MRVVTRFFDLYKLHAFHLFLVLFSALGCYVYKSNLPPFDKTAYPPLVNVEHDYSGPFLFPFSCLLHLTAVLEMHKTALPVVILFAIAASIPFST